MHVLFKPLLIVQPPNPSFCQVKCFLLGWIDSGHWRNERMFATMLSFTPTHTLFSSLPLLFPDASTGVSEGEGCGPIHRFLRRDRRPGQRERKVRSLFCLRQLGSKKTLGKHPVHDSGRPLISHGVRKALSSTPSCPARHWKTQNTVFSRGISVGWHWEHLWLKGKRTGREMGRVGGWWAEDTSRRRTITSLLSSTADGEGWEAESAACSQLPG